MRTTIFYSTHILDDVERVSDTVAILDGGRLVAQAPVHQLLHGDTTSYTLTVLGSGKAAASRLRGQAWVTGVDAAEAGPLTTVTVTVSDERAADSELLRAVLADGETTVTSFARSRRSLEDLFIDLVQEEAR
jgi:ABC-2 type transport system ATP-binding protein